MCLSSPSNLHASRSSQLTGASPCAAVRHKILASEKGEEPRPEIPPPDTSNGHVLIVHRLHEADAEDAWIQREWGEIQAAQGNLQQAATHFEVWPAVLHRATLHQDMMKPVHQWSN